MGSVDGVQELRLIRENTKSLSHASNVPELALKVDEAILQRKVEGIASLASCVAKQDVARIRTMIENAFVDKDEADYDGRTALHFAASAGSMRVVKALLDLNADVNVSDRWGSKPIQYAVRFCSYESHSMEPCKLGLGTQAAFLLVGTWQLRRRGGLAC
jgi:glutaminase